MQRATKFSVIVQRQSTRALMPASRTLLARSYAVLGGQLSEEYQASQKDERQKGMEAEGANASNTEIAQKEDTEGPIIVEDWKAMHDLTGKGRVHPGVVQPEELKKDPKMHEQPIY